MKRYNIQSPTLELQYPIMLKQMSDEEIRQYHRKKLFELTKPEPGELEFRVDGSIYKNGKLIAERPTYEQKKWVIFRLKHPNTWPNIRENKIGDMRNWK